jgi:ParB family chromosome partitioning protein
MQTNRVPVVEIVVKDRLRPVTEAGVASLIASIEEIGVMKDAIHLRKKKDGKYYLIAGGHRLEAAKRLEWAEIEAKVWTNVTDDWARIMEIDDNLAGSEMNALDTAVFLATRKVIYERLHPETKQGGDRRSASFQMDTGSVRSFAAATAEKFGMTDRHVRRMIAAGAALSEEDVARLRAAPKQVALADLQVIGKLPPARRTDIVAALSEGRAKSAAKALSSIKREERGDITLNASDTALVKLVDQWARAPKSAKVAFVTKSRVELLELLSDLEASDD